MKKLYFVVGAMACLSIFGCNEGNYSDLFMAAIAMLMGRWTATEEDKF